MKRVDPVTSFLNILRNRIWDQLIDDLLHVIDRNLLCDDIDHLLADSFHLRMLGVASFLLGSLILVGVSNAEDSEKKSISGLDISSGLDESLPFLDHGSELVGGQIHTMEISEDTVALDILGNELEFSERPLRIVVALQISQGHFEYSTLQSFRRDFCSLGSVDQSLSHLSGLEDGRSLHIIPVLTGEGINDLLLGTLLAPLAEALVLTNSHGGGDALFRNFRWTSGVRRVGKMFT